MVAIRKHAPADATAESLALLAGKIDSMDRRHGAALETVREDVAGLQQGQAVLQQDVSSLKQGQAALQQDVSGLKQGQASLEKNQSSLEKNQSSLERNQAVLMENQLEMKVQLNTMQSQLDLLVAHLIRPTK